MSSITRSIGEELTRSGRAWRRSGSRRRGRAAGCCSSFDPDAGERQVEHQQHEVADEQRGDQRPDQRPARSNSSGPGLHAVLLERGEHDRRGRRGRQAQGQQRHQHAGGRGVVGRLRTGDALDGALAELLAGAWPAASRPRRTGRSGPPRRRPGSAPNGKPSAVPRSHGCQDRFQSARVMSRRPVTGSTSTGPCRSREATYSTSPSANRPTATTTTSMPSSSCGMPRVKPRLPGLRRRCRPAR